MKKIEVLLSLLVLALGVNAQNDVASKRKAQSDSVKEFYTDQAALLYPRLRQFSITHQENAVGDINSKLYGNEFFKGRFRSSRTTINFNLPIIDKPKDILVGSLGVVHQFFYLDETQGYDPQTPVTSTTTYIPMMNMGLSYTHRDTLFNIPFSFTGGANALFDPPMERYRFTFLGLVMVPVIRKPGTSLIFGMAYNYDPSAPAPAILIVSYFHKFRKANLDLMIDLPYRFALRRPMKESSFTLFTEMVGSNSFFKFDDPNPTLPTKMTYSLLEVKSGLMYEYRVTKKLIFSISGGLSVSAKSTILDQGAKPNDYFIKNKIQPVPYGQIGLSLLPFWRPFNKSR